MLISKSWGRMGVKKWGHGRKRNYHAGYLVGRWGNGLISAYVEMSQEERLREISVGEGGGGSFFLWGNWV